MKKLVPVISTESTKLFRSKLPLLTLIPAAIIPLMGGFFMFVLKDPKLAANLGLISTKANLFGAADWPAYFELLNQAVAIGGMIIFGFVTAWIFGREHADRTINDLLALPVARSKVVLAKFVVSALWSLILAVFILLLGLLVGKLVSIPLWSWEVVSQGAATFAICALLTIMLSTPVALFAGLGRGYLAPLGFLISALVAAQLVALTGYGQYFPWSIPALLASVTGEGGLASISFLIVLGTGSGGVFATILWWTYADHS